MGRRAARATHLGLAVLGMVLYVLFVIPRWWVLTGAFPPALGIAGRIAAGLPIAAAAVPVMLTLQQSLKAEVKAPELALRLRAWSAVLHLVAGSLIIVTAVVEIWLKLDVAGPWLFAVYGAAGSIAVLATAAFPLSFVAEEPPPAPKPPKVKKVKKAKRAKQDETAGEAGDETAEQDGTEQDLTEQDGTEQDGTGRRRRPLRFGRKRTAAPAVADDTAASVGTTEAETTEAETTQAETTEAETTQAETTETETIEAVVVDLAEETPAEDLGATDLRPTGKRRHRLRR